MSLVVLHQDLISLTNYKHMSGNKQKGHNNNKDSFHFITLVKRRKRIDFNQKNGT